MFDDGSGVSFNEFIANSANDIVDTVKSGWDNSLGRFIGFEYRTSNTVSKKLTPGWSPITIEGGYTDTATNSSGKLITFYIDASGEDSTMGVSVGNDISVDVHLGFSDSGFSGTIGDYSYTNSISIKDLNITSTVSKTKDITSNDSRTSFITWGVNSKYTKVLVGIGIFILTKGQKTPVTQ